MCPARVRYVLLGCLLLALSPARADDAPARELFEKKIRPVLVKHCYECHSSAADEPKGGLRLDTRAGLREGGDTGPIISPGHPGESTLLDALRHETVKMPPDRKLPADVIADFTRWIELGAVDPRGEEGDASKASELAWEARYQERLDWWSLRPVAAHAPPATRNDVWPESGIDRFVLARLEAHELRPAPRADQSALIRRLSFAITGLPPGKELINPALADDSREAWERLVDRLLASPHFGERWARHWMDAVRYSDTYGYEWDIPAKGAWRYRDYLIRAFNADVPFDQLIREQIAGDLLEHPRIDSSGELDESKIGLMFHQLGEKRHGDSSEFNGIHQEMLDNKIDALSKAFQAVTVSCARCHDHKLDAVSQSDYYALAGILMSSRWVASTVDTPTRHATRLDALRSLKRELRTALARSWKQQLKELSAQLLTLASEGSETADERLEKLRRVFTPADGRQPALESIAAPWIRVTGARVAGKSLADTWNEMAREYDQTFRDRQENNSRNFTVVADFSRGVPPGWSADGVGLRDVVRAGDFTVLLDGPEVVGQILPGGVFTHAVSPRLNGALRTPLLSTFNKSFLSFEAVGGEFAAGRTVIDNAFLTEKQHYLNLSSLSWHRISTMPQFRDRRVYLELATKTSNPNFPPRVGLGGPCSEEQAADPRSWFGVSRVVAHDGTASPADDLARFLPLFAGGPPDDLRSAADRYAGWLLQSVARWEADEATNDDVRLLNSLLQSGLLTHQHNKNAELTALVIRYRAVEQELPTPRTVNGMADVDPPLDYRLNVRGDYDQLGPPVPRGWLRMLSERGELPADSTVSSAECNPYGRRQLAEAIARPDNPLTARVFVNRVWHWLFGAGLVRTTDDFGHLGDQPSHPELLDWLAARFMAGGWSTKRLVREIVCSETWRQSNQADAKALQIDPDNRLLHHMPLRRLEAEAIRDAMLFASGRLDPALYGSPIDPHRANEDPQKRLFSGPIDGLGRRSVYIKMTIMEPPKFLAAFNQPSPKIPTGRRDVTNTPAQSLVMLNDPLPVTLASAWGDRLVRMPHSTVSERLSEMFIIALGRPATDEELSRWNQAVTDFASLHGVAPDAVLESAPVWNSMSHVLFNLKEFVTVP